MNFTIDNKCYQLFCWKWQPYLVDCRENNLPNAQSWRNKGWPSVILSSKYGIPKDVSSWIRWSNRNWIYLTAWFLKNGQSIETTVLKILGNDSWEMENKWCVSINAPAYNLREFPGHGAQRGNQDRAYQITQVVKVELSVQAEQGS